MKSTIERRDFLALMGLSGAVAAIGCDEKAGQEQWKPWLEPVEGMVPYTAKHYATASREARDGSLMVRVMDGRALKVDGNPAHPIQGGTITARSQSIIQSLYGADRVKAPRLKDGREISWEEARALVLEKLRLHQGGNVCALSAPCSGAQAELMSTFLARAGSGRHVSFEAFNSCDLVLAAEKVFGLAELPFFSLAGVDYLVSFGAQFLETWGNPTAQAREYADLHSVREGKRGKHVAVEARQSLSGANADQWLAAAPGSETMLLLYLLQQIAPHSSHLSSAEKDLVVRLTAGVDLPGVAARAKLKEDALSHLADELAHAHAALVLPGESLQLGEDALPHHVAMFLMNKALGAIGQRVDFSRSKSAAEIPSHKAVADLTADMAASKVGMLFIKDVNPVYQVPAALRFDQAMGKVGFVVSLAAEHNETTRLADLVLPITHELESWGEFSSYKGLNALQQPVMRTRFEAVQAEDLLIEWSNALNEGSFSQSSFREVLKQSFCRRMGLDEGKWRQALKNGGVFQFQSKGENLPLSGNLRADFFADYQPPEAAALTLLLRESPRYGDGHAANRGWMQELPDSMNGVTWDSFLEISPATAAKLGVDYGDVLAVETAHGRCEAPVMLCDTCGDGLLVLETGQGHTAFAPAYNRGVNAFALLSPQVNAAGQFSAGPMAVKAKPTGQHTRLATPHLPGKGDRISTPLSGSGHGRQTPLGKTIDRDVYQTMPLAAFLDPHHVEHGHHEPAAPPESRFPAHQSNDFYPDRDETLVVEGRDETFYDPYKWEMAVDLSRCNGCGSCVTACYAENNLPVMGADQVAKGREMSWIRVNRYVAFREEDGQLRTEVAFMPMMCQHCASAPCETVCPSLATYHTHEGLNAMVYNRCVGTRYCANNCVYKVRRFNWFDMEREGDLAWQSNPEVSVRGRGVMEKCSFCVQRIRDAKHVAKDQGRLVADGEVVTACQQACPAQALQFGNIKDQQSAIHAAAHAKNAYRCLDSHLSTKPGVSYLKRIILSGDSHA
jgi:molybdopterin-containing oxidoreductase family iron-sulfur binding subunit